jgi:hypothetical protein
VSVIVAAMVVFHSRGVTPRTWYERNKAKQSTTLARLAWVGLLVFLVALVLLRRLSVL